MKGGSSNARGKEAKRDRLGSVRGAAIERANAAKHGAASGYGVRRVSRKRIRGLFHRGSRSQNRETQHIMKPASRGQAMSAMEHGLFEVQNRARRLIVFQPPHPYRALCLSSNRAAYWHRGASGFRRFVLGRRLHNKSFQRTPNTPRLFAHGFAIVAQTSTPYSAQLN